MAEIEIKETITVSAKDFINNLKPHEVADFASDVAAKFDQDFVKRNDIARDFADSLTESGARFLAEVVTHFYQRVKNNA